MGEIQLVVLKERKMKTFAKLIRYAEKNAYYELPHLMRRVEGTSKDGLLHAGKQINIIMLLNEARHIGFQECAKKVNGMITEVKKGRQNLK